MAVFYIKQGNLAPAIQATLIGTNGTAEDLTSATSVTLRARRTDRADFLINAEATIDDAVTGLVSYQFSGTETDSAGVFALEWVKDVGLATEETYPNVAYDALYIEKGL